MTTPSVNRRPSTSTQPDIKAVHFESLDYEIHYSLMVQAFGLINSTKKPQLLCERMRGCQAALSTIYTDLEKRKLVDSYLKKRHHEVSKLAETCIQKLSIHK